MMIDWDSIWFEEGMCEYLSKKLTLNENQFDEIAKKELELIHLFKDKYGKHLLDDLVVLVMKQKI
ncbi:hypothetical protein ABNX05_17045 [Lysinibacillus sp. M3]|uniref:Uncharacterized protein n=1 Tax=Lysinibacillus zambalensis TaxID=3160866 RepID=A0ABV1MUY9_9BACI